MPSDKFLNYRKLQTKFNLPQLNELKERFKFDIEENDKIFDQIRTEMSDRLFNFTEKIIEPIIAGSDSYSCLFEQDMVSDRERQKLFDMYKKIQVLKWENNLLTVQPDEQKAAEWVKKTWELWNGELEVELSAICKKLSHSWDNIKFEKSHQTYHG